MLSRHILLSAGFAFHQTDRDPTALQKAECPQGRCSNHSRVRDFDLLGYRYSLLSSIGTAGLNSVLNMLPARDTQEFTLFPKEDIAFVNTWLSWTDENVELLKQTRPIPSLATPAAGAADGTIMLHADTGHTGAMFLYNPTMRELNVSLPLSGESSTSLDFRCGGGGATTGILVRQIASSERSAPTSAQAYDLGLLDCASGVLSLTLPATSAKVLTFEKWDGGSITVLGSSYSKALVDDNGVLSVDGAQGESGTDLQLAVVLPPGTKHVAQLTANGQKIPTISTKILGSAAVVAQGATWAGQRFKRAQEIIPSTPTRDAEHQAGSTWTGSFSVPQSAIDQLKARNASYPIEYNTDPSDSDDANVPWLAPGRLLIFVKYQTPIDDTLNVTGTIDGRALLVRKAYNTIVRNAGRFIGHWADVTHLVVPGKRQTLTLQLPGQALLSGDALQGVFFDNVETIVTNEVSHGR